MKKKNHKWTEDEENRIYNHTKMGMSPADINFLEFEDDDSVTIQAIADKASRIVDQRDQPNYGKSWSDDDEKFLKNNLNKPNSFLKPILGRGSKELDQAKWDIRHNGGIRAKRKEHLNKLKLTPVEGSLTTDMQKAYDLITQIKAINPDVIEEIRKTRVNFKENPEPVQVYDYLKLPMGVDIDPKSELRKSMRAIIKRIEELNALTLDKLGKDATISTHQYNLVRQFFGIRVTSHRNLNIQNNVVELQNLTVAFAEHFKTTRYGMKMLPASTPIKRKELPRTNTILELAKLKISIMDAAINKLYLDLSGGGHASLVDFDSIFEFACKSLSVKDPIFDGNNRPGNAEIHKHLIADTRIVHYNQRGFNYYTAKNKNYDSNKRIACVD